MQRLLLSPPKVPLPPITKDLASMLHLGLTDECANFAESSLSASSYAPDQTCFARAFSFNACPINGSVRSAIMQDTPLLYYYILCSQMQATPPSSSPESKLNHFLQSFCRPSASRAIWSTCSSIHAHNAPSIFSQLLSSLIPIMSQNRMCKIMGPHGSGKTTLLQCYAKHVASSHVQVHLPLSPPLSSTIPTWQCLLVLPLFSHDFIPVCSTPVNLHGSTACGFLMLRMCARSTGQRNSLYSYGFC
jgi:hypothetical protein